MPKVSESKVTSNNTTTIPKPIRTALNLNSGETLDWHIEGDDVVIRPQEEDQ